MCNVQPSPLPEVGKTYRIFDDGKINNTRMYNVTIEEIIKFEDAPKDIIRVWEKEHRTFSYLYSGTTDYFVMGKTHECYSERPLYFVRTVDGGWFSIDYQCSWQSARLDVDGSLYKRMTSENS